MGSRPTSLLRGPPWMLLSQAPASLQENSPWFRTRVPCLTDSADSAARSLPSYGYLIPPQPSTSCRCSALQCVFAGQRRPVVDPYPASRKSEPRVTGRDMLLRARGLGFGNMLATSTLTAVQAGAETVTSWGHSRGDSRESANPVADRSMDTDAIPSWTFQRTRNSF